MEDGTFHTAVSIWHYHHDGGSYPFLVEIPTRGFPYRKVFQVCLSRKSIVYCICNILSGVPLTASSGDGICFYVQGKAYVVLSKSILSSTI